VRLEQRLAAGDLDERAVKRVNFRDDLLDRHLPAARERVRRIAPAAAQVAGGKPDEHARTSRVRRLTLGRPVDFVGGQHPLIPAPFARLVRYRSLVSLLRTPANRTYWPHPIMTYAPSHACEHRDRNVRMELSGGARHVERHLLSREAWARVQRAHLLRRTL